MTALADALKGGGKFIRWNDIGQDVVIAGTVTDVTLRQTRKLKYKNGDYIDEGPAFWDDGSPQMEAVIGLATSLRDPSDPEDDGARTVTVNMWSGQKQALRTACKAAGVQEPKPGDTFEAVWTAGAGEPGDPRVFAYRITPGSGLGSALGADPFAAAQAPAAPAQQAAPAPVPTPAPQPASAPPAAPAAPAASKPEQVKALAAAGLDIPTIAAATGYPEAAVAALLNL